METGRQVDFFMFETAKIWSN